MEIKIKKKETKEFIFKLIDKIIQLYDNDININNINEANIIKDKEKIRTIFSKNILFLEKNIEFISKIILIFIEYIVIIPNIENFFEDSNLKDLIKDLQNKPFNKKDVFVHINSQKEYEFKNDEKFQYNYYTALTNRLIKLYKDNNDKIDVKKNIIEYFLTDKKFIKDSFYLTFFYSTLKIKEESCFEDENENILNSEDKIEEK